MVRGARAGLAYFGLVFLLGVILGPFRILVLEPRTGAVPAVLIELPVMLAASWAICGWLIGRFRVPNETGARVWMGGFAFLLLMAAELALGVVTLGETVDGHFRGYLEVAPMIGLLGQVAFAALPLLRRREGPCASAVR